MLWLWLLVVVAMADRSGAVVGGSHDGPSLRVSVRPDGGFDAVLQYAARLFFEHDVCGRIAATYLTADTVRDTLLFQLRDMRLRCSTPRSTAAAMLSNGALRLSLNHLALTFTANASFPARIRSSIEASIIDWSVDVDLLPIIARGSLSVRVIALHSKCPVAPRFHAANPLVGLPLAKSLATSLASYCHSIGSTLVNVFNDVLPDLISDLLSSLAYDAFALLDRITGDFFGFVLPFASSYSFPNLDAFVTEHGWTVVSAFNLRFYERPQMGDEYFRRVFQGPLPLALSNEKKWEQMRRLYNPSICSSSPKQSAWLRRFRQYTQRKIPLQNKANRAKYKPCPSSDSKNILLNNDGNTAEHEKYRWWHPKKWWQSLARFFRRFMRPTSKPTSSPSIPFTDPDSSSTTSSFYGMNTASKRCVSNVIETDDRSNHVLLMKRSVEKKQLEAMFVASVNDRAPADWDDVILHIE